MDFCGGVVFLPYTKIIQSVHRASEILDSCIDFEPNSSGNVIDMTCASKMISTSIYNLFYNGKWQKSTKTTYCQYNNSLWANVTQYEFNIFFCLVNCLLNDFLDLKKRNDTCIRTCI